MLLISVYYFRQKKKKGTYFTDARRVQIFITNHTEITEILIFKQFILYMLNVLHARSRHVDTLLRDEMS